MLRPVTLREAGDLGRAAPALSPRSARLLAAAGALFEFEGTAVAVRPTREPLLRTLDLALGFVDDSILGEASRLRRLLDAANARWTSCDRALLRMPAHVSPATQLGFRPQLLFTTKDPQPRSTTPGVDVRRAEHADFPFVHELLARALVDGYAATGASVARGDALEYVRATYPSLGPDDPASAVVAWLGDTRAGHGAWIGDAADEIAGTRHAELLDVFVLESFRNSGVSAAVTAAIETLVARRGVPLVGHVVADPLGAHRTILERLGDARWSHSHTIWVRP